MSYILTDEQLDRICDNSRGVCDCRCLQCPAFCANQRYHLGYTDEDEEEE